MTVSTLTNGAAGCSNTRSRNTYRSSSFISSHIENPLRVGQTNHTGDCDVCTEDRRNFLTQTRRKFLASEADNAA